MGAKTVNKTNAELNLADADNKIDKLNQLRNAKLLANKFAKFFILFFAAFIIFLHIERKSSLKNINQIREKICKFRQNDTIILNNSKNFDLTHKQSNNFDNWLIVQ